MIFEISCFLQKILFIDYRTNFFPEKIQWSSDTKPWHLKAGSLQNLKFRLFGFQMAGRFWFPVQFLSVKNTVYVQIQD
jgi:hypothetical protein